ncbi:hypothetical protein P9B03_04225 [Metasolibacillus meyeri]|uniref:DUF4367 domain-containing protein n=1 Tax=Metasolibacillus meyeri TaxID=1071052 RepID=A0AAW9NMI8_9BACL|nr:hypothetical protein [Metasolibacillus meyeri]MEC1177681.1 hypothetical protein [Metasolibacillus meyeri]
MNNYTPTEIKDLQAIKQRVMDNVLQEIEHSPRKSTGSWRFIVLSGILTISSIFFIVNQVFIVDKNATKVDFTEPVFLEEQGLFYLHGVTLGDSPSRIIETLGKNYTTEYFEDGSNADLIFDYEGHLRLYFIEEELRTLILMGVNEERFDEVFTHYNGTKFTNDDTRFIYSSETSQIIKAEYTPYGLYVYLMYIDPEYEKTQEFLNQLNN